MKYGGTMHSPKVTKTEAEWQQANITLFNPDYEYTFTETNILSSSKNAIFLNKNLNGKVYGIISNNKMVKKVES